MLSIFNSFFFYCRRRSSKSKPGNEISRDATKCCFLAILFPSFPLILSSSAADWLFSVANFQQEEKNIALKGIDISFSGKQQVYCAKKKKLSNWMFSFFYLKKKIGTYFPLGLKTDGVDICIFIHFKEIEELQKSHDDWNEFYWKDLSPSNELFFAYKFDTHTKKDSFEYKSIFRTKW